MNKYIAEWYDKYTDKVYELMHNIWANPELSLKEYYACNLMKEFVKEQGFSKIETHDAADWNNSDARPNTLIASYGNGHPIIGIVGELDALPDLGQKNNPERDPIPGPGHGCGHNLMGGGAAGAAAALKYAMEKENLPGTVRLIEAPAEEIGVGKAYLAKNGVFSELDMALMWHGAHGPLDFSPVHQMVAFRVQFEFHGKASHAVMPEYGRSALDAVQLMNMGCEFLREHKPQDTFLHYCITNGGSAPNTVPDYASVLYMFRSVDNYPVAEELFQRAIKVAEGAAMMTETTMEYKVLSCMPQFYYNHRLCNHMVEAAKKIPPLEYTEEERRLAREHYQNLFHKEAPQDEEELLPSKFLNFNVDYLGETQCTDASDMTYFCPTIHCQGLAAVKDAPYHGWSVTYTSGNSIGEKAGNYAYKIIAQAGYDALKNPKIVDECWAEYHASNIPEHKDWV